MQRSSYKIYLVLALLHIGSVLGFNLGFSNRILMRGDRLCHMKHRLLRIRKENSQWPALRMTALGDAESYVTVLPGLKQVLFIEVGFGADQHGQVCPFFLIFWKRRDNL
jgi:hypothetical protein